MRVLLVEDDLKIASFLITGLRSAGYAVDHAADGEEGLQLALTQPYDAAVIDLMLPRRNGLALIKEMRTEKVNTPVLILSAKGSVDDRVKGLETGGDDYLTKPFAYSELLARGPGPDPPGERHFRSDPPDRREPVRQSPHPGGHSRG